MNNYLKIFLFLVLLIPSCTKDQIEKVKLFPDPEYPLTYDVLSKQELELELQKFNSVNNFQSLTLNEYGILTGYIPVNMVSEIDATMVKENISMIITTYSHFLGIDRSDNINIATDISIRLNGGVSVSMDDYFKYGLETHPTFELKQQKIYDRKIDNVAILFSFSQIDKKMQIRGRWYPDVYIPDKEIHNPGEALNISIQYIKENHYDVTPLNLSNVEKEKFNKVLFPYQNKNKVELRECWQVNFPDNSIKLFVDTQTGELVYYLDYGHLI
jgi:hypothetical protein